MKLAKAYEPGAYEPNIYALWEASGAFAPTGVGEPYSLVMPPPNANGDLHIGHGLDMNLKDILARYYRMKGRDVVYIPGADHAGFETWVVFEKELAKKGKSRFDFSREELYKQVWDFVANQRGNMELQLRALGVSASWEHSTFTLDKKVVDTVYDTFKKLWDDGLIYRGERIVNYCTKHQTSFADIEVEHKTEKSKLWHIAYELTDGSGEIVIATSRPETKLGEAALIVNPNDERYKKYIGKEVYQPLVPNKPIPVIADDYVDPEFGTGALTITPAHDPNDFEIAKKHDLPLLELIGFDGKMTHNVPPQFQGYTVLEARKRVVAALQAADMLRGEENYTHTIGVCYKCGTVIEPLVKSQWFLKVAPLAEKAKQAIENEEGVKFTPQSKARVVVQYLDNLHDWNLSRQIPWGIPIPAFVNTSDEEDWIFDTRVDQPTITVNGNTYRREEDTFDTWFSSGQWPFIVTDQQSGGELNRFYPTSLMETGADLLDRWVARMLMLGLYVTDQVPFKDVYVHGMVLDEKGQKMSKSKGNVVNPMQIVEEYGSDALRLGIVASRSAGQNQAFSTDKVVAGRNFANKLWNIARYIEGKVGDKPLQPTFAPQTIADHWIIQEITNAQAQIEDNLKNYRFAEAADTMYHAIWNSVADWYLEASKSEENLELLVWLLETILKLAHPFAPFVTETIWQALNWEETPLIAQEWPHDAPACEEISVQEFEQLRTLITEVRYLTTELGGAKQTLLYGSDSLIADNETLVTHLAKLHSVQPTDTPRGLRVAIPNREAWLDIDEKTLKKHRKDLEERINKVTQTIQTLQGRLANESYVNNAPEAVVTQTREQLKEQEQLLERLTSELEII